jgi:hypothetical protein
VLNALALDVTVNCLLTKIEAGGSSTPSMAAWKFWAIMKSKMVMS